MLTDVGPVDLDVAWDRAGTFESAIVPSGVTRLGGFSDTIVAWYATGMSTRGIRRQIRRMYGADISAELVSRVADGVLEELKD
ncbi:MAG: transposase [Acidimicrobiales bacterium]